jgi:DNA-binding CsgD family transcriptional regulator
VSRLLLSPEQFARARDAVQRGDVTPEMYAFLSRLVAVAQRTRTLAPAPVPGGRWDDPDSVAETVQAWLAEALLAGGLLRAFDVCMNPRALSRYLERALRNWLISRSRQAAGPRLLERAVVLLESDEAFVQLRQARAVAERWWGLAEWRDPELFAGGDDEVISAAWALGDFVLLRYPSSERSDPVLGGEDLLRFLLGLLARLDKGLSGAHFDAGFRARFNYAYASAPIALEEAPELADGTEVEAAVAARDAARIALADLTERQLQVLLERPRRTLEEMAARLQVSRGTVDNEWRRALLKVREASPSDALFDAVLENLLDLASEGYER